MTSFYNKLTKRLNNLQRAKKAGLFEHPENFELPFGIGLNLKAKRAVSINDLKTKLRHGKLEASDIYTTDFVVLPSSKRIVKATKKNITKAKAERKTKIDYTVHAKLYKKFQTSEADIDNGAPVTSLRASQRKAAKYAGPSRHFYHGDDLYLQMTEVRLIVQNSSIKNYMGKTFEQVNGEVNAAFYSLINILETDNEFVMLPAEIKAYIACVDTLHLHEQLRGQQGSNPLDNALHNAIQNEFIHNKNIKYEVNIKAKQFSELFLNNQRIPDKIQDQMTANSCFVNLIHATYYEQCNKIHADGKRMRKELTRELLFELLGLDNSQSQDIGLTIKNAVKFFEYYRLGLVVYDIYNSVIFSFYPEKINDKINPNVLHILVHNNHTFRINQNLKTLEQAKKYNLLQDKQTQHILNNLNIDSNYNINESDDEVKEVVFMTHSNDIVKAVQDKQSKILLSNGNLDTILFEILRAKYIPSISFENGMITALYLQNVTVKDASHWCSNEINNYQLSNAELYDNYTKTYSEAYNKIINRHHLSDYNPKAQALDDALPMGPLSGYFNEQENKKAVITPETLLATSDSIYHENIKQNYSNGAFQYYDKSSELVKASVIPLDVVLRQASNASESETEKRKLEYAKGMFKYEIIVTEKPAPKPEPTERPATLQEILKYYDASQHDRIKQEYDNGKVHFYMSITKQNDKKPISDKLYNAIDIRKAYTHSLTAINKVPVFSYFDIYKPYDGHAIEPETMYITKCYDNEPILFPTTISRSYGVKLIYCKSQNIYFEIVAYKRPSQLLDAPFDTVVNDVYSAFIDNDDKENDTDLKKKIINVILGQTEKKANAKSISKIFADYSLALHYQTQFGGAIYPYVQGEYKCYILQISKKSKLKNGFLPIKELIYENHKVKLDQLYRDCKAKNLNIIGVKTDCILVDEPVEKLNRLFDTKNVIGGYKIETDKVCIDSQIKILPGMTQGELAKLIKPVKTTTHKIYNEYDTDEINKVLDNNNRIILKGVYPGVGKTTAVKNFGKSTLFVTPYNKLCQQLQKENFKAITLHKLLGQGLGFGNEHARRKPFDVTDYDVICFDEAMLYGPNQLKLITEFMNSHQNKKFIATGDSNQLPAVCNMENIKNIKAYISDAISMVFPNNIELKINKRLKSEEDRAKLANLKQDIFNTEFAVEFICNKYGIKTINAMSDVNTSNNISYFNYYSDKVNKHCHDKFAKKLKKSIKINGQDYYPGLELVCKKHFKKNSERLFVNYIYKINHITTNCFTVVEPVEDIEINHEFPLSELSKYFKLSYCNTCHSVQGMSISDAITIFNANIDSHVDRTYFWTALTRATDLTKVTVFIHSKEEVERLELSRLQRYFRTKVENYKTQDTVKGRKISEDYITADWIKDTYNACKQCSHCALPFEFDVDADNHVVSNLTVDRIDNGKAHTKNNCVLSCHHCNVSKH